MGRISWLLVAVVLLLSVVDGLILTKLMMLQGKGVAVGSFAWALAYHAGVDLLESLSPYRDYFHTRVLGIHPSFFLKQRPGGLYSHPPYHHHHRHPQHHPHPHHQYHYPTYMGHVHHVDVDFEESKSFPTIQQSSNQMTNSNDIEIENEVKGQAIYNISSAFVNESCFLRFVCLIHANANPTQSQNKKYKMLPICRLMKTGEVNDPETRGGERGGVEEAAVYGKQTKSSDACQQLYSSCNSTSIDT